MLNNAEKKKESARVKNLKSIPVVVLGTGNIGQQFLTILTAFDAASHQIRPYRLVAVADSRNYQLDQNGLDFGLIDLNGPDKHNNTHGEIYSALEATIKEQAVIIDLTASEEVAEQYLRFAGNGWHIISANKIAAANHEWATSIESVLKIKHGKWLKNTTVGAALPIQDAIKKIKAGGDNVRRVSGVFSGSISWLLSQYDGQIGFTDWVKKAHEKTLTEPDPRSDLSGVDVYRKALILARACGFNPKEITFDSVIPQRLLNGSLNDFWQQEKAINEYIKKRWQQAHNNHQQLRYLAEVSADKITIKLKAVDKTHAAANLNAGDNIFIVQSDWYNSNPLVIQGPGAGKEVTAAGVLSDLVEVLIST